MLGRNEFHRVVPVLNPMAADQRDSARLAIEKVEDFGGRAVPSPVPPSVQDGGCQGLR